MADPAKRAPVDLDLVKATLAQRIDSLVPQLYPAATLDGPHWRLGDALGAPGQSLAITRAGANAGLWKDFAGTDSGSPLDLIAHALFSGRVDAAVVDWAVQWCGLGTLSPDEQRRATERARAAGDKARADAQAEAEKRQRSAQGLWLAGSPMARTPVDSYLRGRAIDFAALGRYPGALRFKAEVYNSETRSPLPAMLAYVYDPAQGRQCAVHRTWIARGPDGWIKHPRLKDAKKTFGAFRGGHIPVWRGQHPGPLHELPPGTWIATAEGIENAASIAMQRPHLRCIAHLSLDNLGALLLPDTIGGLYIAADNDAPGSPADAAFQRQLWTLEKRGVPHKVIRAPAGIKDMNDWLRAAAPRPASRT